METPGNPLPSKTGAAESRASSISLKREVSLMLIAGLAAPIAGMMSKSLRMPGHSIIYWFTPLAMGMVFGRLRFRGVGMGLVAGGLAMAFARRNPAENFVEFLIVGVILDAFIMLHPDKGALRTIIFWTLCAMGVNTGKFVLKIATPFFPRLHWQLSLFTLSSYIIFALITGLMVGVAVAAIRREQKRLPENDETQ